MQVETTKSVSQDLDRHLNISEDIVDISEFGAMGDGSTDDTAAIQSAFDYLEEHGGTLNLESDQTYSVTEDLLLQDAANFKINGNGATIKVTDDASAEEGSTAEGGSALRVEDSDHFAIADLAIDDGGASADGNATIEVANGSDFYLSEASSVNFENIGGPAVNLSVLAAADADIANDDADGRGESEVVVDSDSDAGTDPASDESEAGVGLASDATSPGDAGDGDDALSQSMSGLLSGETETETLDFSSLGEKGAIEESGVEDQQLLDAASGGDVATATDDTAATTETGQDDVALLGVTPQLDGEFGFATS